jgi:hypothetical protein
MRKLFVVCALLVAGAAGQAPPVKQRPAIEAELTSLGKTTTTSFDDRYRIFCTLGARGSEHPR